MNETFNEQSLVGDEKHARAMLLKSLRGLFGEGMAKHGMVKKALNGWMRNPSATYKGSFRANGYRVEIGIDPHFTGYDLTRVKWKHGA